MNMNPQTFFSRRTLGFGTMAGGSWKILYVVLLLAVSLWELLGGGFGVSFRKENAMASDLKASQLDSFSPPSIAAGILRAEGERLLLAYTRERDHIAELNLRDRADKSPVSLAPGQVSGPSQLRGPNADPQSAASKLNDLHTQIHSLEVDVDRKLMMVSFEKGLWNEFLDRYLEFLQVAPENTFTVNWAPNALYCAQFCARTEEVRAAMEQVIHFHSHVKTARALAGVLEECASPNCKPSVTGRE
jgi:hypothetical protein